jgi:hypothetical protein
MMDLAPEWRPADAARGRCVLLTPVRAAAAEVSLGLAGEEAAAAAAVARCCGAALLAEAPPALLAAAASAAAQRGWNALLGCYLPQLARCAPPAGGAAWDSPLHAAARGGNAAAVRALARVPGGGGGCADAPDARRGATPLHYAAALRDGAARRATLRALRASSSSSSSAISRAYAAALDRRGRTPAQLAAASAAAEAAHQAAFHAWAARETRPATLVIALLQLSRGLHTASRAAQLAAAPDWAAASALLTRMDASALASTSLLHAASGARLVDPAAELPWPLAQQHASALRALILFVLVPLNVALAALCALPALRFAQPQWHAAVYAAAAAAQALCAPVAEFAVLYRRNGLVVDYTPWFVLQEGLAWVLLGGACGGTFAGAARSDVNAALLALRAVAFTGCLLLRRATWRAAATSPHVLGQLALAAVGAATMPWNRRRLGRLFQASERARRRKAAKAA